MDDTDEGSSIATRSAQDPNTEKQPGLIGRIIAALSPAEKSGDLSENQFIQSNGRALPARIPGILNLRHMRVEDVAIPKAEIVSVQSDIKKDDLVEVFRESGLTRLPVYKNTLDTPAGFVHLKDLALKHGFNGNGQRYNLQKMLRPLLFAPPSMPIGILLQKMQSERIHMALVVDEYGGVDGLVTIENLIEQVVGEIEDEHDIDEGNFWIREKPGCYLADAKTPLQDFEAEIGFALMDPESDEEIETLGGLVFVLTGRVPSRGEVISHPDGPAIEIVEADPRRLKRLRVRIPSLQKDG